MLKTTSLFILINSSTVRRITKNLQCISLNPDAGISRILCCLQILRIRKKNEDRFPCDMGRKNNLCMFLYWKEFIFSSGVSFSTGFYLSTSDIIISMDHEKHVELA